MSLLILVPGPFQVINLGIFKLKELVSEGKTIYISGKRKSTQKIIADIVEALIGVSSSLVVKRLRCCLWIGLSFNDLTLLVEALTHGSYMLPEVPRCYQRLEFLGDAVLDYLITWHLHLLHASQELHKHSAVKLVNFEKLSSSSTFGYGSETSLPKRKKLLESELDCKMYMLYGVSSINSGWIDACLLLHFIHKFTSDDP
ncbi:unnamed protein product [Sphenostylis stenocarpa]|uniref:RNase III domain-containing protein n=1 Tax=Sphenostylis stenocarpa TaxID=92480 RepID=A0AA86T1B7_9FABA|nr:unnamed protein product [Sphenostylis stenocarpa]